MPRSSAAGYFTFPATDYPENRGFCSRIKNKDLTLNRFPMDEKDKRKIEQIFKHHIGILSEDFQRKLDGVVEVNVLNT